MLTRTLSTALLLSTCLSGIAQAADTLDITRIELGQAGIARYAMQGAILGNSLSFNIPQEAASDVLASLVVRDPAGAVIDLQADVPGAARTVLRGTPFAGGVPTDTAGILRALIGQIVSIGSEKAITSGLLMGINTVDTVQNGQRVSRDTALILSDGQMVNVVLDPGVQVSFPQEVAATLAAALQARSRDDSMTRFDLTFEATGPRDINMSYVTEAPAWKNSWRLLLDEGRLQGWATLENLSGQDWDGVEVTLTTGAPVAFRRNLMDPRLLARPDADQLGPEPVRAVTNGEGGLLNMYSAGTQITNRALKAKFATLSPPSGTARKGQADQSHGILRYDLSHRIDLDYGRSTSLMYLDLPIAPEIHAFYSPATEDQRVFLSVSLHSEAPLAAGLISVQDAGGFVGDAPFSGALAGKDTMLPFALASGSEVQQTHTDDSLLAGMKRVGDQLLVEVIHSHTTEYTADVTKTVAHFTVDHVAGFGEVSETNGTQTDQNGATRITVPVKNGTGLVRVIETQGNNGAIPLEARNITKLLSRFQKQDTRVAPGLEPVMTRALELFAQLERLKTKQDTADKRYDTLAKDQARLRDNLKNVHQEKLRQRYLDALDATETKIVNLLEESDALRAENATLEGKLVEVFKSQ